MVCAKCQKLSKPTSLATPDVKKKNEMYYGSPAGTKNSTTKTSATLGNTGIGKVCAWGCDQETNILTDLQSKLLSKGAKNPYAAYSSNCKTCSVKCEAGRKYCQKCAYKANGQFSYQILLNTTDNYFSMCYVWQVKLEVYYRCSSHLWPKVYDEIRAPSQHATMITIWYLRAFEVKHTWPKAYGSWAIL